ncbi:MAG TPA: response regulator, partial [Thermomicrobiaceae bacterium]|nr:response regulator [Thermomicrobiaceae bacterium]
MGRILVADDDPAIRALLTELLSDEGYDVLEAVDGRAAVEIALARQPQVILMDLRMPHLDGIDATRALKADPRADGI